MRAAIAGEAGSRAGADPDALLNRGLTIVGDQLDRIAGIKRKGPLPAVHAMALAGYLRALSAVKRDRAPGKGGAGKYAGMSAEQLKEEALRDPVLAEVLCDLGMLKGCALP